MDLDSVHTDGTEYSDDVASTIDDILKLSMDTQELRDIPGYDELTMLFSSFPFPPPHPFSYNHKSIFME